MECFHSQMMSMIWNIADDMLRDVFLRGQYCDVILPMVILRRLDALLEPTKEEVNEEEKFQREFCRFDGVYSYLGFKIAVPPIDGQERIVKYLDGVYEPFKKAVDACLGVVTSLQERKQIIINEVVTGKVKSI